MLCLTFANFYKIFIKMYRNKKITNAKTIMNHQRIVRNHKK